MSDRTRQKQARSALRHWPVQGARECLEADPAPIDPMVGNQPIRDIHHFDQVDLIALRRFARILPDQLPAIGEERPGSMPAAKTAFRLEESRPEKGSDGSLS